jgi:hypothetical protein
MPQSVDKRLLFSDDYATARGRFRNAAHDLGWTLLRYPLDAKGPGGDTLTIDVALTPGTRTDCALVLSSGLHGVEGFFGSAVQLGLLQAWARQRDSIPQPRCVLMHALNPYGFAWRRRVNEHNVDLNRNLMVQGEAFRGCREGYRNLDELLNPKAPPSRREPVMLKFMRAIARYGMPALKEAIASGQYEYPRGLFFGGDRPSQTNAVLSAHLDEWLGECRRVMHIDFHTGLGAWATCKLLIDYALDDATRERLGRWFGPNSFEADDARGVAYTTRGSFGKWSVSRTKGRDYLYAAAEFGTYSAPRVLAGLRAENQAHHWGKPDDASTRRAKEQLVELFCPRSPRWRTAVVEKSFRLVDQAALGLVGVSEETANPSHPPDSSARM